MRALILLAGLLALGAIVGCGEEATITAPDPAQPAVAPGEAGPDLDRLPGRPYDLASLPRPDAGRASIRGSAVAPGMLGLNITVPDPPNGIYTCQDGVDAAVPGATITVLPTSVVEDVVFHVSDITFRAQGTVELFGTMTVVADRVRIEGFTIAAPMLPSVPVGVWVLGRDGVVIQDDRLSGWDCAVLLQGTQDARVQDSRLASGFIGVGLQGSSRTVMANNVFDELVYGVHSSDSPAGRIRDNTFTHVAYGVLLDHGHGSTVQRNTATATEIALLSMRTHESTVADNVLAGGNWGIELYDSHFNRYTDNKVVFARIDGILIDDSNGNTLLRNDTLGQGDDGLDVHGGSNGNTIIGTVSLGHANNGIELESRTHENLLANSKAHGNASCDIVNYGAANVFQNNEADCTYGF